MQQHHQMRLRSHHADTRTCAMLTIDGETHALSFDPATRVLTEQIRGQSLVRELDFSEKSTPEALQRFMSDKTPISGKKWSERSPYSGAYFPILDEVILRLVFRHKPLMAHYTIAHHELYGSANTGGAGFRGLPTTGSGVMYMDQSAILDHVTAV